jgi:diguanylate cyclase (GGDEF)-like protein
MTAKTSTLQEVVSPVSVPEPESEASRTDRMVMVTAHSVRGGLKPRLTVLTGLRAGLVQPIGDEVVIGRSRSASLFLEDPGVSRRHARITRTPGGRYILEDLGSTNGTLLNGSQIKSVELQPGDRVQVGSDVVIQFGFLDAAEERLAKKLYEASTRDALTGAYNRKYFLERMQAELSYARRHRASLAAMLVDIDRFKSINDNHGHAAGDVVLRAVATQIAGMVRTEDAFSRYGGEEFALIARGGSLAQAARFAERIRAAVEAMAPPIKAKLRVTVSIGVAEARECDHASVEALLGLADQRLYAAKRGGRNRVCSAD